MSEKEQINRNNQKINGKEQINRELKKLRRILASHLEPSPLDAAVIETLASPEVGEKLIPILDEGAILRNISTDYDNTIDGLAQITIETQWLPDVASTTPPLQVVALTEISPPQVLKVVEQIQRSPTILSLKSNEFSFLPATLKGIEPQPMAEAEMYSRKMNNEAQAWLKKEKVYVDPSVVATGLTSGSYCTGALCIERTSEDFD